MAVRLDPHYHYKCNIDDYFSNDSHQQWNPIIDCEFLAVLSNWHSHLKPGEEWPPECLQIYCRYHCRIPLWEGREKTSISDLNHRSIFLWFSPYLGSETLQACLSFGHFKRPVLVFIHKLVIPLLLMPWLLWYVRQLHACAFMLKLIFCVPLKFCFTVSVRYFTFFLLLSSHLDKSFVDDVRIYENNDCNSILTFMPLDRIHTSGLIVSFIMATQNNTYSSVLSYTIEILPYPLRAKGFTLLDFAIFLSSIFNQ